ncbi:hypothetical protein NW767_013811 [Fusarium falciforme]|uniref:Uncharacterized protein n=1 Tax=Fusarium falciforme TaxID=195108 RepID=A0A9W8QS55_9HYPO|nr:hypothetical protein NW755_014310 [Fusarium falciforme]KAJ4182624.1 hypothetical protein NW767_013811 [Fusarium falciforme]
MRPIGRANATGFETVFDIGVGFNDTHCVMVAAVKGGQDVSQLNTACLEGRKLESLFDDEVEAKAKAEVKAKADLMQKVLINLA